MGIEDSAFTRFVTTLLCFLSYVVKSLPLSVFGRDFPGLKHTKCVDGSGTHYFPVYKCNKCQGTIFLKFMM